MPQDHFYLGIDLGTTNSSIHWGHVGPNSRRVEPRELRFDQAGASGSIERRLLLPSYIWFLQGEDNPVVGEYARTQGLETQPSRVARFVKNHMGDAEWKFQVDDKHFRAADLSTILLKTLHNGIVKTWGRAVDDVIITVPASFDGDMRADTLEAARRAGFKVKEADGSDRNLLLDEPRAALYDLLNEQASGRLPPGILDLSTPKTVLVFDLGGGTLDVSIHEVFETADDAELGVTDLAIGRYAQLGGFLFDQRIADALQTAFEDRAKLRLAELSPIDARQIRIRLEVEAERIKQRITNDISLRLDQGADANDVAVDVQMPFLYENKGLRTRLTRADFEAVIAPLLGIGRTLADVDSPADSGTIIDPILDVLAKARTQFDAVPKIDAVILNGGMTRVHAIQERLTQFFGFRPISVLDPENSVSRGASVYHYLLHRGWRPKQILAETISLEVDGGRVFPLIPAGTVLPTRRAFPGRFQIPVHDARSLNIPLYRGEGKTIDPPNQRILERRFDFASPQPANTPLQVEIAIDDNKIVHFTARLPTGDTAEVRVGAEANAERIETSPRPAAPRTKRLDPISPTGPARSRGQFMQDFRAASKIMDEPRLKKMGADALRAENSAELMQDLLALTNEPLPHLRPARQRALWVLGEFAARCPDTTFVARVIETCLKVIAEVRTNSIARNTLGRNAVHALGKIGTPTVEQRLITLLNDESWFQQSSDVLTALGKCGRTIQAFNVCREFLELQDRGHRINALWAIGRIGSRERTDALPITEIAEALPEIGGHSMPKQEKHVIARKHAVYALGEIGDRRPFAHQVERIDDDYAEYILELLEKIMSTPPPDAKNQLEETHLRRLAEIAHQQVLGATLTEEQERILLSVRTLMSAGQDE